MGRRMPEAGPAGPADLARANAALREEIAQRERVEEALRASEQKYRTLVETTNTGYVIVDSEGRVVDANAEYVRLTGHAALAEILGRTVIEWTAAHDLERNAREVEKCARTGQVRNLEIDYVDRAGRIQPIEINATVIQTPAGPRILALCRDIGGRRLAASALEDLHAHKSAILATALDGIVAMDQQGRIIEFNPAAERTFGLRREEVLGRTVAEVVVPARQRGDHERGLARFLATGQGSIMGRQIQMIAVRADGTEFPCEISINCARPEGRPLFFTAHVRDITGRKRAEAALRQAELQNSYLVESVQAIVWRADAQTFRFSFVSPEAEVLLGYPVARWIAEPTFWKEHVHVEDREWTVAYCMKATASLQNHTFEYRMIASDGRVVWLRDIVRVVVENGRARELVGVMVDITDRKHAEEEIRVLNQTLEQRVRARTAELQAAVAELEAFSYSVSHDLRAPLRAIDGYCQALVEDCLPCLDEAGRALLDRVRANARKMAGLIDGLIALSRLTRDEMRVEGVNLSDVARSIVAELAQAEPEREVEVVVAPGLAARGDARLLRTVLENLLRNAWKFTGGKPRARIEVGRASSADPASGGPGERLAYFVRDDGAGFDMAFADKLFRPFERLHGQAEFPGTGIGLATAARIVRRHGGAIWAEGAVGRGATFRFTLGEGGG